MALRHRWTWMGRPLLTALLIAGVVACCAPDPNAEAETVACAECEIQLVHVTTLGDHRGGGEIWGYPASVVRDSRGRLYVAPTDLDPGPPLVYDREGRFLRRLGRSGDGPGEYERVSHIVVGRGDTLYVSDDDNLRLTVVDSDYRPVRAFAYDRLGDGGGYAYFGAALGSGALVLNNADYSPGALPFVAIDSHGTTLRSFGPPAPEWSAADEEAMWQAATSAVRLIAPARSGGFWTIPALAEPALDRWSEAGELVSSTRLAAEWWTPGEERPTGPGVPYATVTGLWEDRAGRLWTVAMVPSPDWMENRGRVRNIYASYENHELFYDAIIEVRDPHSGERIASATLRNVPGDITVVTPGWLASRRPLEDGRWLVEVWRVRGPRAPQF